MTFEFPDTAEEFLIMVVPMITVLLFVAVIPVLVINIRRFQAEEALR